MAKPFASLGTRLLKNGAPVDTTEALEGKEIVLLVCGSYWCPYSKRFHEVVKEHHEKLTKSTNIAVVFVSLKNLSEPKDPFWDSVPWWCLEDVNTNAIKSKLKLEASPTMAFLDTYCAVVGAPSSQEVQEFLNAVGTQAEEENGVKRKCTLLDGSTSLERIVGPTLTKQGAAFDTIDALSGKKNIMLLIGASSSHPSRLFIPKLAAVYMQSAYENDVEIVYVSRDKDSRDFDQFFASMPWLAIPYRNEETRKSLSEEYDVETNNILPKLIILDGFGRPVSTDGVNHYHKYLKKGKPNGCCNIQ